MKSTLMAGLLVSTLFAIQPAEARPHDTQVRHHPPGMAMVKELRGLSLSEEQKEHIKALLVAFKDNNERPEPPEKNELESASEAQIRAVVETTITTHHSRAFAMAELRHKVYALLTIEQQSMLAERELARTQRHTPEPRPLRPKPPFNELVLSDDQKATLDTLQTEFQDNQRQHNATMDSFKDAEKALVRSDNFSESAWQGLLLQYQDTLINAAVENIMNKQSMLAVLTDEQRTKLKQWREEEHALRRLFNNH